MCWIRGGWEDRDKVVDLLVDMLDIMVWVVWMDGWYGSVE